MVQKIKAHFDGRAIIPDEPLEIPANTVLTVEVHTEPPALPPNECEDAAKRAAVQRILSRSIGGLSISDDALRREALYGEE